MFNVKRMSALLLTGLLVALGVSGCTTTEFIHVTPECTPPPSPVLPVIDRGDLWDSVGDAEYRRIESYINQLWAFSDEQGAMLEELCNG